MESSDRLLCCGFRAKSPITKFKVNNILEQTSNFFFNMFHTHLISLSRNNPQKVKTRYFFKYLYAKKKYENVMQVQSKFCL